MKRILSKTILGLMTANLISLQAHAALIDLNDSVNLEENGISIVTAYRDDVDCLIWRYMPDYLVASQSFANGTDIDTVSQGSVSYPAYISAMDFTVQSRLTEKNKADLKAKILVHLKAEDKCKASVTPDAQISLQEARVQAVPVQTLNTHIASSMGSMTATLRPSFGNNNPDVMRDGVNPITATLRVDASNPQTPELVKGMIDLTQVQPQRLGEINYTLTGVVAKVASRLTIKGDIQSIFKAHMKEECDTQDKDKNANHGLEFGSYNEHNRNCSQKLLSDYLGGKFENIMTIDDRDSQFVINGKQVMYTWYDDKNEPQVTTLQDFIHAEMFHLLLMSKYDAALGKIIESTYVKTAGQEGTAVTTVNINISYLMSFQGQFTIKADVFADHLDARYLRNDWVKDPFTTCVQKDYRARKFKPTLADGSPFPAAVSPFFAPLNDKCLAN